MKEQLIMNDWLFYYGKPDRFVTPEKKAIDLPHDMMVNLPQTKGADASSGFYPGCAGTYEKFLDIPAEWEGEKVYVQFDGVYMHATVSLNGSRMAFHPYGYTSFLVDITRRVRFGERNRLEVVADNTAVPNCRWYSGAGIYRNVKLLHGPSVRIQHRGIYLKTEAITEKGAVVSAEVRIVNDRYVPFHGHVSLILTDADGSRIQSHTSVWVEPREEAVARFRVVVPNAKIWDVDHPFLYTVKAGLTEKGQDTFLDSSETRFGIRTVSVDTVNGLRINGKTVKLKGGCMHHVTSPLGSADFDDQTRRVLIAHKNAGYNAFRLAHNPPSERFLDLCDEYGFFVVDEAFDGWHIGKTSHDYHEHFDDWWERDIEAYMLRDRNHPSVVIWSIGNEVYERAGTGDGYLLSQKLAEKVRSLDNTRPVMLALCSLWNGLDDQDEEEFKRRLSGITAGQNEVFAYTNEIWADRTESMASPVDIVGYNYMEDRYVSDHEIFPDRIICGTESFPMAIDRIWPLVEQNSYVIGDFTWTSSDYIGEAGIGAAVYVDPETPENQLQDHNSRPYPWKLAYDADWDILNMPRPQLAFRRIVWGSGETYIAVRDPKNYGKKELLSPWAWPEVWNHWTYSGFEGEPIEIDVYSPGDKVELLVNGVSVGTQKTERYIAKFKTVYTPGVIEAVSFKEGAILSRDRLETAGEPVKLMIRPENTQAAADGQGLLFAAVEFVDSEGRRVPYISKELTAEVQGKGELLSFASANPITDENYGSGRITSFDGRAMAFIRAGREAGKVILTVTCDGFEPITQEFDII